MTPASFAGWSGKGAYEPDTTLDITGGWMFTQPDVDPSQAIEKVYFNGFLGQCTFPCLGMYASFNPNSAVVRSGIVPAMTFANALFGVWKDCNKDGVIGLADQGLVEYRSDLLVDKSVCPAQTTPIDGKTGLPPLDWFPSHNDGQWVREYLPFSHDGVDVNGRDPNPWNINAPGTLAWNDGGLPGQARSTAGGCYVTPQPVGTYRSTGGMLRFVDCHLNWQVTDTIDTVLGSTSTTKPLGFSDHPRDQGNSASPLNQKNPWGTESDASYAQVWDCGQPQVIQYPVKNNEYVNVSAPKVPPSFGLTGSMAGTMNSFGSGFDECHRNDAAANTWIGGVPAGIVVAVVTGGQLHLGQDLATLPYGNEGGSVGFAKTSVDGQMGPGGGGLFMSQRPAAPASAVLGKATPPALGTRITDNDGIWQGSYAVGIGNVFVDPVSGKAVPVRYMTYYAFVDPTTVSKYSLTLPKGATATAQYGIEACGGATSGIVNGWNCDKNAWGGTKVGDAYNLRDVDCYDTSVQAARAAGVSWGTLTGTHCPYAP